MHPITWLRFVAMIAPRCYKGMAIPQSAYDLARALAAIRTQLWAFPTRGQMSECPHPITHQNR